MRIEIFDVEHGSCALVTADSGAKILIDCGFNSSTGWKPSSHFPTVGINSIEMFVVTNYDEDHVADLPNLRQKIYGQPSVELKSLLRNISVTPQALADMKKEGGMGNGIRELAAMINSYTGGPLQVYWGSLSYKVFHNSYPQDFTETNNLSLVIFLHCHGLHIVFPGDLENAGWGKLLANPEFVEELKTVNVFVASHHGRENGCCQAVFNINGVEPRIVIFSDSGIQYDTQQTVAWYRNRSSGMDYNGTRRHVFTTRNDGKITIDANLNQTLINTAW